MSRRNNTDRCETCRMHATLCICALVPRLATRTRVAVLIHYREARKPTNTGQLAARCIERSTVEIVGDQGAPIRMPVVHDGETPVLLYPSEEAVSVCQYANNDKPVLLIVPDGTWRQASKLRRRVPGLVTLPCVTVPDSGATEYRLRAELRAGGLATFEAIARALRILEGEAGSAIESAMTTVFRVMVDRTLWFRGALRDADVSGGIPSAAVLHDPRGTRPPRAPELDGKG
jgi:DTW domain-containing protein